jgi:hypothetical protein
VEAAAERTRMFRAEDFGVGVVVEEAELLAPGDEHRKARCKQQAYDRSQRLRPGRGVTERRSAPVMATHQCADLAAAGHELQRSIDRVSHRVPGVLRRSAKHRKLSETSEADG